MSEEREIPVREFADRGTIWLLESPESLRDLVRLMGGEVADRLDFSRAERINRSFIPDDLQKQEADLLFRVPFREGKGEVLVYVLLEHQSRPDRTMGLRLLSYMVELWQSQIREYKIGKVAASKWRLHPIVPIGVYTGKRKWKSPINMSALMELPDLLEKYVPAFETLFLNLQEPKPEDLM